MDHSRGARNAVDRDIVWGNGQRIDDLAFITQGPASHPCPEAGQEPVIIACASAEPVTPQVEGQSGNERPVNIRRVDFRAIGLWLGYSQGTGFHVESQVPDLVQA